MTLDDSGMMSSSLDQSGLSEPGGRYMGSFTESSLLQSPSNGPDISGVEQGVQKYPCR
jgi:hypothetical protein